MQAIFDISKMRVTEEGVEDLFWPVTRKEQEASRDEFLAGLVSAARAKGDALDEERDLLSAINQLLVRDGLSLYLIYVISRRAKDAGRKVIWPPKCQHCHYIDNEQAPKVDDSVNIKTLLNGPVSLKWWRRFPSKFVRDVRYNGFSLNAIRPLSVKKDIIACYETDVLSEHARASSEAVKYTQLDEWFTSISESDLKNESLESVNPAIRVEAVNALRNSFRAGGEELPDYLALYFDELVSKVSAITRIHLNNLLQEPEKIPKRLWTGSGGYIWARLLRHVVRRLGGEVTGHEHGTGESIITYFNTKTFSDLESADRFITFNSNQRQWLEDMIDERFLVPEKVPAIEVPHYRNDLIKYAGMPLRGKKEVAQNKGMPLKVMYVGSIYVGFTPRISHHNSDVLAVDWQARLFARLREWGCEILLKPHPEGEQRPPADFVENFGAKMIAGPFEDVWSQADVFLFDWKSTTAFSTAISTGLPLVLVDFGFETFSSEMQVLVEKNCSLVKGYTDNENRLQIDWDELRNIIQKPISGNSQEVREKVFRFK